MILNIERVEITVPNRGLAQWRVSWLIEHSTSHQLLWHIDSFVLVNRHPNAKPQTVSGNSRTTAPPAKDQLTKNKHQYVKTKC